MPEVLNSILQWLLQQGPLGIAIIIVGWDDWQQRLELRALRNAHKVEIAAERKLNADLQEHRIQDYKMLVEVSTSIKMGLEGVLTTLRNLRDT